MSDLLIGVDLGTSAIKATLFNASGKSVVHATRQVSLYQPAPGVAEQDGNEYYQLTLSAIHELIRRSDVPRTSVAAITFDGQMGGAIGIDREWQALTPWYPSGLDNRIQPLLEKMLMTAGNRIYELSGALPVTAPRILWWRETHPLLYRRIDKVLVLANYVAGRLAGLKADDAFIDPSYLCWYGFSDVINRAWSDELLHLFDVPLAKLPRIVSPKTVIGHLKKTAADACGLVSGIPLVAGVGDAVAGFLGAGVVESGQLIETAGTFNGFGLCLDQYLCETRHGMLQTVAGPLSDNHWYSVMYITGAGLTHRWFVEEFGFGPPPADDVAFQTLDVAASQLLPGSEGLLFIPHLLGRVCPSDPDVRGAWVGFSWTHKKAHFYRAMLESIAYDLAQALNVIREYYPDLTFRDVRIVGGGSKSDLWNQIRADVLGLPYLRLQSDNLNPLGCAIIGGHAVGIYANMAATAQQFSETIDRFEPRPDHHQQYQAYVKLYQGAFDKMRDLYGDLITLG